MARQLLACLAAILALLISHDTAYGFQYDGGGFDAPPPDSDMAPCRICIYLYVSQDDGTSKPVAFPFKFTRQLCANLSAAIIADIYSIPPVMDELGSPFQLLLCSPNLVKVCGGFTTNTGGAALQSYFSDRIRRLHWKWFNRASECHARLIESYVMTSIGGDDEKSSFSDGGGDDGGGGGGGGGRGGVGVGGGVWDLPQTCLADMGGNWCHLPTDPNYPGGRPPPWRCPGRRTDQLSNRFALKPEYTVHPGARGATRYCFQTATIDPSDSESSCGRSTTLAQARFWLDSRQRDKLMAVGAKPRGEPYTWTTTVSAVAKLWATAAQHGGSGGGSGGTNPLLDDMLVVPLNWTTDRARGGQICLDLAAGTDIRNFCRSGYRDQCWVSLVDDSPEYCCPQYAASGRPISFAF